MASETKPAHGDLSLEELRFGFRYGPGVVTRLHSDERLGVWFEIVGERERVEVRVTQGGRIRVLQVKKNPRTYLDDVLRTSREMLRKARR